MEAELDILSRVITAADSTAAIFATLFPLKHESFFLKKYYIKL